MAMIQFLKVISVIHLTRQDYRFFCKKKSYDAFFFGWHRSLCKACEVHFIEEVIKGKFDAPFYLVIHSMIRLFLLCFCENKIVQ